MALFFNVSADLEQLSERLAESIRVAENGVFDPHYIVTQTDGMNNWLRMQLATRLGIAGNVRFQRPNDLINLLYFLIRGEDSELLSSRHMSWLIYRILGERGFVSKFPSIAAYYTEGGSDKDTRRIALAEKMADLFDQYQIYRTDMMRGWNSDKPSDGGVAAWQQYLWMAARTASGNRLPDKSRVGDEILNGLKDPELRRRLRRRLPAVHIFGLSIITDYHIRLLSALSEVIDVHFHLLNPAPAVYWFDDRSEKQIARWRSKSLPVADSAIAGNALLGSWGKVLRDTFGMLFSQDLFLNAYEELESEPPVPDNLLHKIQHDIFYAAQPGAGNVFTSEDLQDGSLTMSACYTIPREVEVLYNYLVHIVMQGGRIAPRDIVVMVSDVDAYAPYIKAVFGNAPYRFRYTIADESFHEGDTLLDALRSVLQLTPDQLTAETVMQLLDRSYIRRRFGISDPVALRELVAAAGIRFGIDGRAEDDTRFVSWRHGVRRIMYGICMSGDGLYGDGDDAFYPLDLMEGGEAREAIRFCHFAEVLITTIEARRGLRTISGWVSYIDYVLHELIFEPESDADEDYHALMQQLSDYNLVNDWMGERIPFEVFISSFLQSLHETRRSGLYANGGITFCSLIPMRSIPFKVVAMLGMDFDKFPRREMAPSFNLMARDPRRGDRSTRENDKHLFLETLLSARDKLYISYRGRNAKDNSHLPPSALVDELLDYIGNNMDERQDVRHVLVRVHPLHAHSKRYASGTPGFYDYLNSRTRALAKVSGQPQPQTASDTLNLEALRRFLRNPIRSFYNHRLGIYYAGAAAVLPETELFQLDHLQQWQFKGELLQVMPEGVDSFRHQRLRTAKLPLANMAHLSLANVEAEVAPVRERYLALTGNAVPKQLVAEMKIDGISLQIMIPQVFERRCISVCWSKSSFKYVMDAGIYFLAGRASDSIEELSLVLAHGEQETIDAAALGPDEAKAMLSAMLKLYSKGLEQPLAFSEHVAVRMHKVDVEGLTPELWADGIEKSLNAFNAPCDDPYVMREYENGLFEGEAAMQQYLEFHRVVIEPLQRIFPGYFL
jgi:exodeoxyribonuclease V gamma subunit